MSTDTIPQNEAKFDEFQKQYVSTIAATPDAYGHTKEQAQALVDLQSTWTTARDLKVKTAEEAYKAAEDATTRYDAYAKELRSSIRRVNAIANVDNAVRGKLGIPKHAETRKSSPTPTTRPILRAVDKGAHRHELHWVDETTPRARRKPEGVEACELFLKIGDPAPIDERGCLRVARDTATPYLYEFDVEDVGKTAYWFGRWVNSADEPGPLSIVVSAKINP